MSKMQGFVHNRDRTASPQQPPPGKPSKQDRQVIGVNAKMKKGPPGHNSHKLHSQAPALSGIPSRGLGYAQNSSAALQHAPQSRQLNQVDKRDRYDTDVESIDTTVNQSVIESGALQLRGPQYQQHDGEPYHSDDADEDEVDFSDDEDAGVDARSYEFTDENRRFLQVNGVDHLDREEAFGFLLAAHKLEFPTIDGDSYPTTTEGDPSELNETPQAPSAHQITGRRMAPNSHPAVQGQRPVAAQVMQHEAVKRSTRQPIQKNEDIFERGQRFRDQQHADSHGGELPQQIYQTNSVPLALGQPPTYSQASREIAPVQHRAGITETQRSFPPQPSGPVTGAKPPVPINHAPLARKNVVPIIQHPPIEVSQIRESIAHPDGDYDLETLQNMTYDQLKKESFDYVPRATAPPLNADMLQKPLNERLAHVKDFEANDQMSFFHSLSTTEWEDSGDWFLDEFSNIIKRTKEARQTKRKLAQGFEADIEKRYQHVSKRQHQAELAMNKMKAHGESLMPKSPRATKSPKPKKRSK